MISCHACQRNFGKKRHLRLHFARKHVHKSEWTSKCEKCGKVYADDEILQRHIRNHEKRKIKVQCPLEDCGRFFLRKAFLDKHIASSHAKLLLPADRGLMCNITQKKKYCCGEPSCGASFGKHHLLTQHSFVHTGVAPFACGQCEKRFATLNHRNRHEKVHLGYKCKECPDVFTKWSALVTHSTQKHKEYHCQHCGKIFHTSSRLKQHTAVHSEVRPVFQCSKCDRNFTKKHALRKHISIVHEGLRQYACCIEGCGKKYAHCHSLKKHINKCHGPHSAASDIGFKEKPSLQKTAASRILGLDTKTIGAAMEVVQA